MREIKHGYQFQKFSDALHLEQTEQILSTSREETDHQSWHVFETQCRKYLCVSA